MVEEIKMVERKNYQGVTSPNICDVCGEVCTSVKITNGAYRGGEFIAKSVLCSLECDFFHRYGEVMPIVSN